MNKKYLIGIGIISLLILSFVVWKVVKTPHQNSSVKSSRSQIKPIHKEVTIITLDKNGFSPKTVTIKVGSAIRWLNNSGSAQTVNSDNYPTNQLHRELNFGEFANGSSVVYTFTKPGTYGYHNHFHHTQEGKIIVVH
jgi:plastocyanin